MKYFIIYPTQLFKPNVNLLNSFDKIFIIEDPVYINKSFHKQKLLLHIASMKCYFDTLSNNVTTKVIYMDINNINYQIFKSHKITLYDPIDKAILNKLNKLEYTIIDSPAFICTLNDLQTFKNIKQTNNYSLIEFYKWQRLRLNILINKQNKPIGGKWSFDVQNRAKYPTDYIEPIININLNNDQYIKNAVTYINKNFANAFGEMNAFYFYNHKQVKAFLIKVIKSKLNNFGIYQDAISKNIIYGNHFNISAYINIGLISPDEVIREILKQLNKSNLNSCEALIRQIIGWREYMRFNYHFNMNSIKSNLSINLTNSIPNTWYTGNTGIEILDNNIQKVKQYAYLHHIERLMIMNNIFILSEFKFNDIYKWFMTCFIDSYDWVMIPNILMNINSLNTDIKYMKRMYICSAAYITKMSDYKNKRDKDYINNLYDNFLIKYNQILKKDYILAGILKKKKIN